MRMHKRHCNSIYLSEMSSILLGDRLTQLKLFLEYLKFRQQNSCLHRIKPTVHTHSNMVVAFLLTMPRNLSQNYCQRIIIGK
ncbi:hypothetical protein C163_06630 [Pseudomonas sp. FGI182]|nr:hypothetical protein C163_06630 [Pseudomonas sp. FGI182]